MKYYKLSLKIVIVSLFFPIFQEIRPLFYRTSGLKKEILPLLFRHKKFALGVFVPSAVWFLVKNIPISFSLKHPIYKQKTSYEIFIPQKKTTVSFYYIHGWAEKTYANKLGNTMQDAMVIVPHFTENIKNRRFKTAFGQELDVISILESLKENYQKNDIINIVARSRGAQAFLNTLYVLCTENHPLLEKVGIDTVIQKIILEKMQKGVIILVVPLIDIQTTFTYHLGLRFGKIMSKYIFPFASGKRYTYRGMYALQLLKSSCAKAPADRDFIPKLNISIIFAKDDWVTGVREPEQQLLIKTLNVFNQKEVEVFYVEGGHKGVQQKEKMQELIREKIIKQ